MQRLPLSLCSAMEGLWGGLWALLSEGMRCDRLSIVQQPTMHSSEQPRRAIARRGPFARGPLARGPLARARGPLVRGPLASGPLASGPQLRRGDGIYAIRDCKSRERVFGQSGNGRLTLRGTGMKYDLEEGYPTDRHERLSTRKTASDSYEYARTLVRVPFWRERLLSTSESELQTWRH